MKSYKENSVAKIGFTVGMLFLSAVILFPLVWMFLTSIKSKVDAMAIPPVFLFVPTWKNYYDLFAVEPFFTYFGNSLIVGLGSVALALLVGIPAAYALSRFRIPRKEDIAFYILSTRMVPPITFLIPFFILFRYVGLTNTRTGLIILHITLNLALVVWLLRGFFQEIPIEMEEAALVDGCSRLRAFARVTLPLAAPGIAATSVLSFIFSWNELMFAITLTSSSTKTAPAAIYNFIGYERIEWGMLSAAGIIALIPVFIFILMVQKYLIKGLTFGAIR